MRFVTSCSRPPLLFVVFLFKSKTADSIVKSPYSGFKELAPNFCIRDSGGDQYRLPTSSTCVNLLKASCLTNELRMHFSPDYFQLPIYKSDRVLRVKLLQAITSGAGFDLS